MVESGKASKALSVGANSVNGPCSSFKVVERPVASRYLMSVVRFRTLTTSKRFIAKRKMVKTTLEVAANKNLIMAS